MKSVSSATVPVPAHESTTTIFLIRPWKRMLKRRGMPTLRYLTRTEAHTFAFSVAANAILAFFPFMMLLGWLVLKVFHSQIMFDVVLQLLHDQLPVGQDMVVRNLRILVENRHGVKIFSMAMLLVSSTGIFLPLEVAFNQIWGFTKNRSYLGNQLISLVLAFICGILALCSVAMGAAHKFALLFVLGIASNRFTDSAFGISSFLVLKGLAIVASVAMFFILYWRLPNGKVSPRSVLPAAVAMGLLWDISKYIYIFALPWLNFKDAYGPFTVSVTLMFWAFISGLLVLAGAHLAAGPTEEMEAAHAEDHAGTLIADPVADPGHSLQEGR